MNVKPTLLTLSILALGACSGGASDSNFPGGRSGDMNGKLTLSVTDGPVVSASKVVVQFDAIEIKPTLGSAIVHTLDAPMSVDLLALQGGLKEDFFNNIDVPSGTYDWVRLMVSATHDGMLDSYIDLPDGSHELEVPSGSSSGLKINTSFVVGANSTAAMTIDFVLQKSIVEASGMYYLKPVLRLVDNGTSGNITGSVSAVDMVTAECSDSDPATGNAVYVFAGYDADLDDIDGKAPEAITTAFLTQNTDTGDYDYNVGFMPAGNYTVAYTCMADLDNPETDDAIVFKLATNVTVQAPEATGGAEFNR